MKKLFLFVALCLISATTSVFGQAHTQSISFDDGVGPGNAGTYNSTDSFSVDLYLTFNGYNACCLSLWFETTANAAPFMSLTGFTYGTTFPDPTQPFSGPIGFTALQFTGLYTTPNPSDLGGTWDGPPFTATPPGTYFIGHLTVSLAGLAPGIYVLQTDATPNGSSAVNHQSAVGSYFPLNVFADEYIPSSEYTITVVPEPETLALLSLGAIGLVAASRMRKA